MLRLSHGQHRPQEYAFRAADPVLQEKQWRVIDKLVDLVRSILCMPTTRKGEQREIKVTRSGRKEG